IVHGVAHKQNLTIHTTSSTIKIRCNVNLAKEKYNEQVTVIPKISSGVAIAGAVLGGPVVGVALLVAQQLLDKPLNKITSVSYNLTGSWGNPTIQTVKEQEKTTVKE